MLCPKCLVNYQALECKRCEGKGSVWDTTSTNRLNLRVKCPTCKGKGRKYKKLKTPVGVEMTFVQAQKQDPARWVCRRCSYSMTLTYGETESGKQITTPLIPKPDPSDEEVINHKGIIQDFIKRRLQ